MWVRADRRSALLALWVAACAPEAPPVVPDAPPPPAPTNPIAPETEPVATVDGVPIDLATFNARYRARMPELGDAARGYEEMAALRLKREVLDELIDDLLVARAVAARGVTGDDPVEALLGPDSPTDDPTVAARRHAARREALLAELRAAAVIENHLEARTAPAFTGAGEPARLGAGFASVKDHIPTGLPSSDLSGRGRR